jgi:hypothetical protein
MSADTGYAVRSAIPTGFNFLRSVNRKSKAYKPIMLSAKNSNAQFGKNIDKKAILIHKRPNHAEVRSLLVRLPDFKSGVGR